MRVRPLDRRPQRLQSTWRTCTVRSIAVALSGGRDSVVLLDAPRARRAEPATCAVAVHVHHGLSPHADAWAAFCARACRAIATSRCHVHARRGIARAADQPRRRSAPAALRGAGRGGARRTACRSWRSRIIATTRPRRCCCSCCAAPARTASRRCPRCATMRAASRWWRPLLDVARARHRRLRGAARACAGSTTRATRRTRHLRNAVRHAVMPALAIGGRQSRRRSRAPPRIRPRPRGSPTTSRRSTRATRATARRSSRRARRAAALIARATCCAGSCAQHGLPAPSVGAAGRDAGAAVQRARRRRCPARACRRRARRLSRPHRSFTRRRRRPSTSRGDGESELDAAARSSRVRHAPKATASTLRRIAEAPRCASARAQAASACSSRANRPRRALKSILQEAGMPPWERAALPLVYCGDALAAVAGNRRRRRVRRARRRARRGITLDLASATRQRATSRERKRPPPSRRPRPFAADRDASLSRRRRPPS